MYKYAARSKPIILLTEQTFLEHFQLLKQVFNDGGMWIEPASKYPADKHMKMALFTEEDVQFAGKKGYAKLVGKKWTANRRTYVVFPPTTDVGTDKWDACVRSLMSVDMPDDRIHVIKTEKDLTAAIKAIKAMPYLVCDFETRGVDPFLEGAKVLMLAAGVEEEIYVMPLSHPESPWLGKTKQQKAWLDAVYGAKKLMAFNAKYELRWFMALGYPVRDIALDPMVLHHDLHEYALHGLDILAAEYTDYGGYDKMLDEYMPKNKDFSQIPLDVLALYNGRDVLVTALVGKALMQELQNGEADRENSLATLVHTIDMPPVSVLAEIEATGMALSLPEVRRLIEWYENGVTEQEEAIKQYKPLVAFFKEHEDFNFRSGDQLRYLLYEELKFKPHKDFFTEPSKKYPNGVPSVDKEAIKYLIKTGKHLPVLGALSKRARMQTMLSSFLYVFRDKCVYDDPEDESGGVYMHTTFNQHVVETFRLSSKDPNLQNIPRSNDLENANLLPVKSVFTSRFHGGSIIQADYSQIELRFAGMYTGDDVFCRAFNEGRDLHGEMAEKVWGKGYTKEQRSKAKRANFSAVFDVSPEGLVPLAECTLKEAEELLRVFHEIHPKLFARFNSIWKEAQRTHVVRNMLGRERHIGYEIEHAEDDWKIGSLRRSVYNFPIQSSASDLMKIALLNMNDDLKKRKMESKIICTVHDSMYVDATAKETKTVLQMIKEHMVGAIDGWNVPYPVPINVDVSYGPDMHNLEDVE